MGSDRKTSEIKMHHVKPTKKKKLNLKKHHDQNQFGDKRV